MAYNFSHLKLLIVDDYDYMVRLLQEICSALSFDRENIVTASDGEEALIIMRHFKPDLIIADLSMKPMGGLDLLRAIRSGKGRNDPYIPILICTGHTELNYVKAARDAGATEIVRKPITPNTMYSRITLMIEKPRQFVRSQNYTGPDRRRKDMPFEGEDRRSHAEV